MAMGSPILKDFIAPVDAIFVERMKRAGSIIIGKTNTPEFGLGSQTYNPVFGTTLNAYDQTKTAGRSSGGPAGSLALPMLPLARRTHSPAAPPHPAPQPRPFPSPPP